MSRKRHIKHIRAKLDAKAAPALREEIERLRIALEQAEARAERAEREAEDAWNWSDKYREDAFNAIELTGAQPGITIKGRLVPVQQEKAA